MALVALLKVIVETVFGTVALFKNPYEHPASTNTRCKSYKPSD